MIKGLVKYGLTACLSLFMMGVVFAQPSFMIDPAQQIANNGDRICLDLDVDDFTDILTVDFDFAYDPTVMTFDDIAGAALPGLDASSFTVIAPGQLRFSWTAPNAGIGVGEDFPDFQPIVSLCFNIVGAYGASTPLAIASSPTPNITRQNSGNRNIGLFQSDGLVAVGVLPLHFIVDNGGAAEGTSVCIPIRANNFTDIVSFQFSVNWDPTILRYTGVTSLNTNLPGLTSGSVSSLNPGEVGVLYPISQGTSPETLADSSILFQLCFDIVGTCDQSSVVELTGTPVIIEAYNSQSSQPIGVTSNDGQVDVFGCGGGLRLIGDTRTAAIGDAICIPFEVQGFQNINAMDFDIDFNPSIIAFDRVEVLPGAPTFFTNGNFDISQSATGKIRLTWSGPGSRGYSLPNGHELFQLCFTVVGSFNVNGVITPDGNNGSVTQSGAEIGLNPRPGTVVILPSDPLFIKIPDATDFSGTEVCLDITADFFDDLQTVRYTTIWEPSVLQFKRVENFGLPMLDATNFVLSSPGNLELNWYDFSGTTLGPSDVIYTLCFDIIGPSASCTPVEVADFPMPIFVESASNRGYNIGLDFDPGEVCAIDTRSFTFDVGTANVTGAAIACVPVTVTNYEDIENWSLSLAWNPAQFTFESINGLVINATANTSEAASGRVGITYARTGDTTIVDGTQILELCFSAVDPAADGCSPILEELRPEPNFAIEAGQNFSVVVDGGEICQQAGLSVVHTVTPASCSNTSDGAIDLTVGGGSGSYRFDWISITPANTEDQTNLAPGTYSVVVTDRNDQNVTESLMITVTAANQAPFVDAGRDTIVECGAPPVIQLSGSADPGTYNWRVLVSGTSIVDGQGTLTPSIFGAGPIELTVTSNSGCISKDTIDITRQVPPTISIFNQGDLPCEGGDVDLEITVNPVSGNYTYSWSTSDGNIVSSDLATPAIVVNAEGNYVVLVEDNDTGCTSQASIPVSEVTGTAVSDAGEDAQITCTNTQVTIGGPSTTDGGDYQLEWTTPNGTLLAPTDQATAIATSPGKYFLSVREIATGCIVTDSVEVTGNGDLPDAQIDQSSDITCDVNTAELTGSGSTGPQFTYIWTATSGSLQGGPSVRGLTATALQPGTYVFTVTDTLTGCDRSSSTTVGDSTSAPVSQLPATFSIDCGDTGNSLIDPAYASDSSGFDFKWIDSAGDTVSRTATLANFSSGVYELLIENQLTGCSTSSTIQVSEADAPIALLSSTENTLICGRDSVAMDFSTSTIPANATISWLAEVPQIDGVTAYAVAAGNYQLIITTDNGACADTSAAIVISDSRTVLAVDAGSDLQIDCISTNVDATPTPPTDASWIISWSSPTGGIINAPTTLAGGFGESGTYVLTFRDPVSNCTGRDTLLVTETGGDNLDVALAVSGALPCTPDSVQIDATPTSPDNAQVSYMWRRIGDAVFADDQTIFATAIGFYEVEMTYDPTGCTALDTIEVIGAGATDLEVDAGLDQTIACSGTVDLMATAVRSPDNDVTFDWAVLSGSEPTPPSNDLVTISNPGTFEVTMTYNPTGCTVTDTVVVGAASSSDLEVDAGIDQTIPCGGGNVDLTATVVQAPGNDVSFVWAVLSGVEPQPAANATVTVTNPGTFEVTMTYNPSGCTVTDTVVVTSANSDNLEVDAGVDQTIPCGGGNIDLTATVVQAPGNDVSFVWAVLSGVEPQPAANATVTVSSAGTFEVTMTYTPSGCTVTDTVEVLSAAEFSITADAVQSFPCDASSGPLTVVVDNVSGSMLTYTWQAESGMLLTPPNQLAAEATVGVYWFFVADAASDCTDSVRVELVSASTGLEEASVTFEEVSCGEIIQLDGNLPAGSTGTYAALSDLGGAIIDASTDGDAEIIGLAAGDYTITYALSNADCGTYSIDTLMMTVLGPETVKAEDDLVLFLGSIRDTTLDLSLNDAVGGEASYTLLNNTSLATLTESGILSLTALPDSVQVSFEYEVCNLECPGNCATATAILQSRTEDNTSEIDIPNAITPNGDGLNDAFVIDELLLNPQDYPNARLIVFNRWGDVLISAQPYNNDWEGTNVSGEDLPEGTYYYVLELDIGSGEIFKGNVTILRP